MRELLERAPLGLDLHEPQVEPEYVWRTGCYGAMRPKPDGSPCFVSELGAWRERSRRLARGFQTYADSPLRETLPQAMAGSVDHVGRREPFLILYDDDGKEIRRWTL